MEIVGCKYNKIATMAVICEAAGDVPENSEYADAFRECAEGINNPGFQKSTHVPWFENDSTSP